MFAFFCFALVDTFAKLLAGFGFSVLVVAFFRYAVNLVLVLLWFLPREGRAAVTSAVPHIQILRGLCLLCSTVLNFWALSYLPLTTTIPIFFATPLVVCLLSVPLLGERVGFRRFAAVLVGFLGVLLVVRPTGVMFHWAMVLSLGATTGAAFYFILTRKIAGRDDMPVSQIFMSGCATTVLLPFAVLHWDSPANATEWTLLLAAGSMAALGHCVLTIGYRYGEASQLTPVIYTQIVWIILISWLVFGQIPDAWTALGTTIIILSGLYVWLRERRSAQV